MVAISKDTSQQSETGQKRRTALTTIRKTIGVVSRTKLVVEAVRYVWELFGGFV